MTAASNARTRLALAAAALVVIAGAAGYGLAQLQKPAPAPAAAVSASHPPVLYWYDPMVPDQHFDKPGKSPMGMEMIPRYADEAGENIGVQIDPAASQNLGVRLATVERAELAQTVEVTGVLDFNLRDVAVIQARAGGFVQRVYGRAPGDVVHAGAPIADLLIPTWGGAQAEYLAVRASGTTALEAAARQRLRLLGMPEGLIDEVARSGRPRTVVTIIAPIGGAIQTLDVRQGMTVTMGQNLATISGLSTVWLNAAVPEAQAGQVHVGSAALAELAAFPGQRFEGRVTAILPTAQADSRTFTFRVELPNRDARLRPGMFATVHLVGPTGPALVAPSEAVIRTGRRNIVMVAEEGGRYRPVEVQVGREDRGRTEILAGLSAGQKVVASGQFLIDSEASLAGVKARPLKAGPSPAEGAAALYETRGRVEAVGGGQITFSHEAVPALGWPAMTMTFGLDPPALANGVRVGDRLAFSFEQRTGGPVVRRLAPAAGQ